jgi:protein-L-isoaspartate(D-aspartate) O-methyltransferase
MTSQRTRQRLIDRLKKQGITNPRVLSIMGATPRHIFVDEALAHRAYEDTALPIGFRQTLSQPYTVARMTELLLSEGPRKKVLEIGSGSGYQTAVLGPLVDQLYSVERIAGLYEKARDRIKMLGMRNVQLKVADGAYGWPDKGPFDGILAAAAHTYMPDPLINQLAEGGILVMPLHNESGEQRLVVARKQGGELIVEDVESANFVPFKSGVESG